MSEFLDKQHKTYANNIVGLWHNISCLTEMLLFSLLDDLGGEADVVTFNADCKRSTYSIVNRQGKLWFLILWERDMKENSFYLIEVLKTDMMILSDKDGNQKIFSRKPEIDFADKLLKGLE